MKSEINWWDKVKPWVEIAGVILLLIYTTATTMMYFVNERAANAATSAANTAANALNESRKAFKIEQRPYVTLQSASFDAPPRANQAIGLTLTFNNSGRSPALKGVFDATMELEGKPVKGYFTQETGMVVAAQEVTHKHYIVNFGSNIGDLTTNTLTFKGRVEYTDIFKDCHVTTFCAVYDGKEKVFKFCAAGNDLDEQPCHSN